MPQKQHTQVQEAEEVAAFVKHSLNKGVDWEKSFYDCTVHGSASTCMLLLVHLAVVASHFHSCNMKGPFSSHSIPAVKNKTMMPLEHDEKHMKDEAADMKISDLLASDPVTMLYDAASLLMMDRTKPAVRSDQHAQHHEQCCNCSLIQGEVDAKQEESFLMHSLHIAWPPVFSMAFVSMTVLLIMMGYFSFNASSSSSSSRGRFPVLFSSPAEAKRRVHSMAWRNFGRPLILKTASCLFSQWTCCFLLHWGAGLGKLAICSSMHISCCLLGGAMMMAYSSPMASVFMPRLFANTMACGLAMLLFSMSHFFHSVHFSSEEFYTNHLWTVLVICPAFRCLTSIWLGQGYLFKDF